MQPSLVVIDPAGSALEGAAQGESQPVRAFVRAVERESRNGRWGTLVIAHDNKTHCNTVSSGGYLNSGAVSGSAAWIDAARNTIPQDHLQQEKASDRSEGELRNAWLGPFSLLRCSARPMTRLPDSVLMVQFLMKTR